MKNKTYSRRFVSDASNHIYQISENGGVLFYNQTDLMVFVSCVFSSARKHNVTVTLFCPMITHVHIQAHTHYLKDLSEFVKEYSSIFAKCYNKRSGHKGQLFKVPFGSAPKPDSNSFRTNCVYILNNPVVKHLCDSPEQFKWNFLSLYKSDNTHSSATEKDSKEFAKAKKSIRCAHKSAGILKYEFWDYWKARLTFLEYRKLVDFFTSVYAEIDYYRSIKAFGSIENMIMAARTNSGKEFDISEWKEEGDFRPYGYLLSELHNNGIEYPYLLSEKEKMKYFFFLKSKTGAKERMIKRVLHINY